MRNKSELFAEFCRIEALKLKYTLCEDDGWVVVVEACMRVYVYVFMCKNIKYYIALIYRLLIRLREQINETRFSGKVKVVPHFV